MGYTVCPSKGRWVWRNECQRWETDGDGCGRCVAGKALILPLRESGSDFFDAFSSMLPVKLI